MFPVIFGSVHRRFVKRPAAAYIEPTMPRPVTPFVGCDVFATDSQSRVLLIRRQDNGLWALPGGCQDLGRDSRRMRPPRVPRGNGFRDHRHPAARSVQFAMLRNMSTTRGKITSSRTCSLRGKSREAARRPRPKLPTWRFSMHTSCRRYPMAMLRVCSLVTGRCARRVSCRTLNDRHRFYL